MSEFVKIPYDELMLMLVGAEERSSKKENNFEYNPKLQANEQ